MSLNARADLAWFVPRQGPFYGLAAMGPSEPIPKRYSAFGG